MREKVKVFFDEMGLLHRDFHKLCMNECDENQISFEQWKLLFILSDHSMNQKMLAKLLHISEATLSVRMKRLEKNDYIIREVNEKDKRNYNLVLTNKAIDAIHKAKISLDVFIDQCFMNISDEEINQVLDVIYKIKYNMRGEQTDA